ncbi:hypothetical protein [Fusobacterium sp.]|uniref:hypothetical protein n=2 Tax=Fusobacterium sp. TaxID=68766 RepID=UPI00260BF80C|nr:hypothetical protein [Fusobacterium sp.]
MKILIKDRKWNIFVGNVVLVCDIHEKNGIFSIEFPYEDKIVSLKSNNIDRTLQYLESTFLKKELQVSQKSA